MAKLVATKCRYTDMPYNSKTEVLKDRRIDVHYIRMGRTNKPAKNDKRSKFLQVS